MSAGQKHCLQTTNTLLLEWTENINGNMVACCSVIYVFVCFHFLLWTFNYEAKLYRFSYILTWITKSILNHNLHELGETWLLVRNLLSWLSHINTGLTCIPHLQWCNILTVHLLYFYKSIIVDAYMNFLTLESMYNDRLWARTANPCTTLHPTAGPTIDRFNGLLKS